MSGATDPREVLRRALLEIRSLKERLAAAERAAQEGARATAPIAVVGIGCRFGAGVDGPATFWQALMEGRDAVGPRPAGRWAATDGAAPRAGAFLADVQGFDPRFFGIAPREAAAMDPQHRLLLEVTWEALAHAALDPAALGGSRTGVFVGLATNDFARRVPDAAIDRHFGVGTSPAVAAGRIAYLLDLRGPCLTLDTACSSSLVAVHQAMRALRGGECDMALAGGVSLMLSPALTESFASAGMLAPDGRCKSFDARADGYGRGEGAGVVVLKRLPEALRDGDPVLAVLRGSAINQDGRSAGLTAPNGPAQTALIRAALETAGLAPADIDYVEAHGTGTPLGDPIEWHALAAAFAGRDRPLWIGAAKSQFGHTEAAAGIAGLIKAVLVVGAGTLPPNLHFTRRNPAISAGAVPLEVPVAPQPGIRRAGVSAFGFSGTNAHVVVEAPPPRDPTPRQPLARPAFVRMHIPLPEAPAPERRLETPAPERRLEPDDPLLAGTDGLAHLGVLLSLLGEVPALDAVAFPAPLAVAIPLELRVMREGGRVALQSRPASGGDWTTHLAGTMPPPDQPPLPASALDDADQTRAAPDQADLDAAALYDRIAAAGFRYGPQARCLHRLRIAPDRAEASLGVHDLSPGTIEAAAQLAYALLPEGADPIMLASAEAIRRGPGTVPVTAWIRRIERLTDGGMRAAFGLRDAAGGPVLTVLGARFAPLPDLSRAWTRAVTWRSIAPLPAGNGAPVPAGNAAPVHPGNAAPVPAGNGAPTLWHAPDGPPEAACAALLAHLAAAPASPLRIVTRGAQHTGTESEPPNLGHAALWGMALAVIAERPDLRCRLIDLDPDLPAEAQAAALAAEAARDDEPAVALRTGRRLARRLVPPARPPAAAEAAVIPAPGLLRWQGRSSVDPGPGQVRIAVAAAGLTFRDRLLFNGLAPVEATLGADCAGVIEAVGPGVAGLSPGDRVVALAATPIADTVLAEAALVAPSPCADLVGAASMPVPYLTALAALPPLGPDDTVLVHQAASATGLAAQAVARRAGARVIVTAAPHRHAWLCAQASARGEERGCEMLDSRAPQSWAAVLPEVTVAFGAFDPAALAVLETAATPVRRVVNLDKRAATHFDLDRVPAEQRGALLRDLACWPPLPRHIVPREALAETLGGPGPIAGRTVVLLRPPPPARIARGSTWLVTGAAGALGRLVADWLAARGARLCLLDRVPVTADPPHRAVQADAGDEAAMAALLADLPDLAGVVHCAAVVDDDRLEQQTPDRIAAVLRAKVDGARVLDRLTRARRLDHFVLFGSIVGLVPSARQAGYAAANAVLDQIAQSRRQAGLPGLSLDWGPWQAGIGRAMGVRAAEAWRAFGVTPLLPAAALRALPTLLAAPEAQLAVADLDWAAGGAAGGSGFASHGASPASTIGGAGSAPSGRAEMAAGVGGAGAGASGNAASGTSEPVSVAALQAELAPLLGVTDPATLDPETPLLSFGLDSLSALDFARALSRRFGRPVAPDFVYNHPTLAQAAQALSVRRGPVRVGGFRLLAPRWSAAAAEDHGTADAAGWTVVGDGPLAVRLRGETPGDPAKLLDLSALAEADPFPALVERLRPLLGRPARVVLVGSGPLADALAGFAAGIAAEQPAWHVRSVALEAGAGGPEANTGALAAALAALVAEADGPGGARLRLSVAGREVGRLVPVAPPAPWRPSSGGAYLVTGGTGGIGARVARHLLARGAAEVVLAARRPVLPALLADQAARVRLVAADLGACAPIGAAEGAPFGAPSATTHGAVARLLDGIPTLRGIFHAAGVTADGTLAAGWGRIGRGFPAKAWAAAELDRLTRDRGLDAFVLFGSSTAWFGLPGTAGYAAANGALEGIARARHAAGLPALSVAWGAWQGIGMASDAALWQDGRVPSLPEDTALAVLDAALGSGEPVLVATDPAWPVGMGEETIAAGAVGGWA